MPKILDAQPQISILLFKTISRQTTDGSNAVSTRYEGKDTYIDLTRYLNDQSAVSTTKSVREAAGGFSISFADAAQESFYSGAGENSEIESIYGLVEPMDVIEIRMWGGVGTPPETLPIIMRGFVSSVTRTQVMGESGKPQRAVVVSGQDYGKIWQMFQVIYLAAFADGQSLLTNFGLMELFGINAENAMKAPDFVKKMVEKIINPYLEKMLPDHFFHVERKIQTGASISVKRGKVGMSYQAAQGALYDIMRTHGDVGVWNELYTEDREDGVHCVYRATPAMHLSRPDGLQADLILEDAVPPEFVDVLDHHIENLTVTRSDANVANFFWVEAPLAELLTDIQRKLASIPQDDGRVRLKDYANNDAKYYGLRPMYATTQQADDATKTLTTGLEAKEHVKRETQFESWVDKRRKQMMDMNKDNVVFERGTLRCKGGLTRIDGTTVVKAGDYLRIKMGRITSIAYAVSVSHEFFPFRSYTTTAIFERGTGFVERIQMGSGRASPWLAEQATRAVD
jgi:hypothetical protein